MRYHIFESGSKGNATLITSKDGNILIDDGISKKTLVSKLAEVGFTLDDISCVLITHSHSDHIKGLKAIPYIKYYCSKETFKEVKKVIGVDETVKLPPTHILSPFEKKVLFGFEIEVVPTSHDARGSYGFIIKKDNQKLVYMTDTGFVYEKVLSKIIDADYYIFESNHDIKMLLDTSRPQNLKDRIMGDRGHLSNEDCALYLSEVIGPSTKEIILAHLSEEANTPEKALCALLRIMEKRGISLENVIFKCASQKNTVSGGILIEDSLHA